VREQCRLEREREREREYNVDFMYAMLNHEDKFLDGLRE
jgi:predicted nucleic acid-binding Zn ribbon protein